MFQPDSVRKRSHNLHEAYQLPCVQWITTDGYRRCPKHVGFYDKNKCWILMHLVGYFFETYHDARSPEHKVLPSYLVQTAQLFICLYTYEDVCTCFSFFMMESESQNQQSRIVIRIGNYVERSGRDLI